MTSQLTLGDNRWPPQCALFQPRPTSAGQRNSFCLALNQRQKDVIFIAERLPSRNLGRRRRVRKHTFSARIRLCFTRPWPSPSCCHHVVCTTMPAVPNPCATSLANYRSVLPPPPRYPIGGPYGAAGLTGIVPMIETNNTISNPTGPEWQFLVGEGKLPSRQITGVPEPTSWLTDQPARYICSQGGFASRNTPSTSIRGSHREPEPAGHQPATCNGGHENDACAYPVPAATVLL